MEEASFCEGARLSLLELVEEMKGGSAAVICLSLYCALSILWGIARIAHYHHLGPRGGEFPPDRYFARAVIVLVLMLPALVEHLRDRARERETERPVAAARAAAAAAGVRRHVAASLVKEVADSGQEGEEVRKSGLAGPSYHLRTVSEGNRVKSTSLTAAFATAPSPVLKDRVAEWVEEMAASKEGSEPSHSVVLGVEKSMSEAGGTMSSNGQGIMESSALARTEGDFNSTMKPAISLDNTVRVLLLYHILFMVF